jgi:glucose-6-phosphate 1-dehydrogenase
VQLDLDFDKRFGAERVGAYERLLLDVIDGRLNLFVRSDEQEEAWRWVEPILDHWNNDPQGPRPMQRHLGAQRLQRHDCARRLLLERKRLLNTGQTAPHT